MPDRICSVEDCERPAIARGLCASDWSRWRRANAGPIPAGPSTIDLFWAKVDLNGPLPEHRPDLGPCWLWTANLNKGYGTFNPGGGYRGMVNAHRWLYERENGLVGEGLELDHLCRVRRCVRPAHLEPVTHRINVLRGASPIARCAERTECMHGHLFDEANTGRRRDGGRYCRTCERERMRATHRRNRDPNKPVGWHQSAKTHCPRRHPYDEVNTGHDRHGHRYCRSCAREKAQERRDRGIAHN